MCMIHVPDITNVAEVGNIVKDIPVLQILQCVRNIVSAITSHILVIVKTFVMMHGVYIVTDIVLKSVRNGIAPHALTKAFAIGPPIMIVHVIVIQIVMTHIAHLHVLTIVLAIEEGYMIIHVNVKLIAVMIFGQLITVTIIVPVTMTQTNIINVIQEHILMV